MKKPIIKSVIRATVVIVMVVTIVAAFCKLVVYAHENDHARYENWKENMYQAWKAIHPEHQHMTRDQFHTLRNAELLPINPPAK